MQKPAAQPKPRGALRVRSRCGLRHETCRSWHYQPRNSGGSQLRNPGQLIFSPPLLSPDAVRPWMCVWPPPLQRQLAEMLHRRHSIANSRITGMKLRNCGNRASTIALLSGQRTGDRTQPQVERFSTQQTLPPVGTGSKCLRHHFSAGVNVRSKSLFYGGEQPWQEQFCQIHRREQSGFSLVWERYQSTTTTSPLSPAVRSSLCSRRVSNRWVPLPLPFEVVCFNLKLATAFPDDFANGFVPRSPMSPFGLELENILEDHAVSSQVIHEMLAL